MVEIGRNWRQFLEVRSILTKSYFLFFSFKKVGQFLDSLIRTFAFKNCFEQFLGGTNSIFQWERWEAISASPNCF